MNCRNFTRVDYSEFASIRFDEKVYFGTVENISLQGLFLKTHEEIPLNTPVDVAVYHSPDHSIRFSAAVVRQESCGIAMRIRKMDSHSFFQLKNVVAERCPDQQLVFYEIEKMACCIC